MFPRKNAFIPRPLRVQPDVVIITTRPVVKTLLCDGLVTSIVTHEDAVINDLHQNYRDYSIQTLLNVQAIDLLKPVGSIPVDKFAALDNVESVAMQMSNFNEQLNELKQRINASTVASNSSAVSTSTVASNSSAASTSTNVESKS